MSLKLFRDTEFASSTLRSHHREELAMHPLTLVALASLWLALLGNVTLWQTLLQLPADGLFQVLTRCVVLMLQIFLALCALLSLLAWRWTLKPAIALLMVVSALAAMSMQASAAHTIDQAALNKMAQAGLRAWLAQSDPSWIFPVLALLVVPMVWLLPTPLRRLGLLRRVLANLAMFVVAAGLLLGSARLFIHENQLLMKIHPVLYEQVNPLASLYALWRMAMGAP
jgi:lipid A ethanolaminephosphotransferase